MCCSRLTAKVLAGTMTAILHPAVSGASNSGAAGPQAAVRLPLYASPMTSALQGRSLMTWATSTDGATKQLCCCLCWHRAPTRHSVLSPWVPEMGNCLHVTTYQPLPRRPWTRTCAPTRRTSSGSHRLQRRPATTRRSRCRSRRRIARTRTTSQTSTASERVSS